MKQPATLVMGNESNGLSQSIEQCVDQNVRIPHDASVESLNVSMATTVILAEFRRRVPEL
jgi:tRNA G18 (ribose-2'-O)-methylase SpoU